MEQVKDLDSSNKISSNNLVQVNVISPIFANKSEDIKEIITETDFITLPLSVTKYKILKFCKERKALRKMSHFNNSKSSKFLGSIRSDFPELALNYEIFLKAKKRPATRRNLFKYFTMNSRKLIGRNGENELSISLQATSYYLKEASQKNA